MRYLWLISGVIVVGGLALIVAGLTAGVGPVGLIAGVLMVWSGIVKVIVLRIWRSTLASQSSSRRAPELLGTAATGRRLP
jgi:hypothetical protein